MPVCVLLHSFVTAVSSGRSVVPSLVSRRATGRFLGDTSSKCLLPGLQVQVRGRTCVSDSSGRMQLRGYVFVCRFKEVSHISPEHQWRTNYFSVNFFFLYIFIRVIVNIFYLYSSNLNERLVCNICKVIHLSGTVKISVFSPYFSFPVVCLRQGGWAELGFSVAG